MRKPAILTVDDDPMVATTIQRVLRPEGYAVDVALGGGAALEQARVQRPDLVVLDVMMPGIDGVEVCRRLDHENVKVIILTARDDPRLEDACREAGADAFLTKPFSSIELLDLIDELFWRTAHNQSTSSIATPQVAAVLRQLGRRREDGFLVLPRSVDEAASRWHRCHPDFKRCRARGLAYFRGLCRRQAHTNVHCKLQPKGVGSARQGEKIQAGKEATLLLFRQHSEPDHVLGAGEAGPKS